MSAQPIEPGVPKQPVPPVVAQKAETASVGMTAAPAPNLNYAKHLLAAGMKLVPLARYTKRPVLDRWNDPSNFATSIAADATGYGLPLVANQLCSIDPDRVDLARVGLDALGLDLDELMAVGARTVSTRPGSGGRSTFRSPGTLARIVFATREHGTILELRDGQSNLQDCVPGVVYADKEGELRAQAYAADTAYTLDDPPDVPVGLLALWQGCTDNIEKLHEAQEQFAVAVGGTVCRGASTGRPGSGAKLAFAVPGRQGLAARFDIPALLAKHGYDFDRTTGRWSRPGAEGAPGIAEIPGKDGLWHSHHGGDPLCGSFDGWSAYVVLEHGGDVEAACAAVGVSLEDRRVSGEATGAVDANPPPGESTEDDDLDIESLALPEFPDDALYGPLREIVERATADSEATRAGVAAAAVTNIAAAALQPFGVPLGDDVAGLNLFMLLVGPSAKGRKGTSSALVEKRLMPALRRLAGQAAARVEQAGHARAVAEQRVAQAESVLRAAEADLARADDAPIKRDGMTYRIGELKRNIETATEALEKRRDELHKKIGTPRAYDNALAAIERAQVDIDAMKTRLAEEERVLALFDEILSNREAARGRLTEAVERARYELQGAQGALEDAPDDAVDAALARLAKRPHRLPAVSSGEGVVAAIADPTVWPDGTVVAGTDDKRLLIDLPEFGGLLANNAREGSMTSAIIRDAYDGRDLATTGKHKPMQASKPHVSVFGNITGAELVRQLFDPRDRTANADNGFANRFVMSFSRRTKLVANPQPSAGVQDLALAIYRNIARVYRALRPSGETWATPVRFLPDGLREWEQHYPRLTNREGSTERSKKLFGRLETNARKLAAVLAVINGEHEVGAEAVRAAVAWIEYSAATIDVVVATVEERRKHRALLGDADKVVEVLRKAGMALSWRDLERATGLQRQRLRHAAAHLAGLAPPRIRVGERDAAIGNGATRTVSTVELLP